MLILLMIACSDTADIQTEPLECSFGYALGEDGLCYEVDADTDEPVDDTGDTDTEDTDVDTDTDLDTDTGPVDGDGDGYAADADCNDGRADIYPGAPEICDALDNDCDSNVDEGLARTWYPDHDGDGFGNAAGSIEDCAELPGHVENADDCDDYAEAVYPGAPDDQADGMDNDCDGTIDEDFDACAVSWGDLELTIDAWRFTDDGESIWDIAGEGTICSAACADPWIAVEVGDTRYAAVTLPYDATSGASLRFDVSDPGAPTSTTCEVYTSSGGLVFTAGWRN